MPLRPANAKVGDEILELAIPLLSTLEVPLPYGADDEVASLRDTGDVPVGIPLVEGARGGRKNEEP